MIDLAGLDILLVEDERFIRTTLKQMLRAFGKPTVREASDGEWALAEIGQKRPDLVLCDIGMAPMSGLAFLERLRQHPNEAVRTTPVVMLTGHSDPAMVKDAVRLQISGYLLKPVSPKDLAARLKVALERRTPSAA